VGFIPEWAIGIGVIMIAISIARAIGCGLRHSARRLPTPDSEVSELREALDTMQNRLAELEERVDFSERLLAKHRE
jgi:hypothetical protein